MIKSASRRMGMAVLAAVITAGPAAANPVGGQIFTNIGVTTADGSATGNIGTATTFGFADFISTLDDTGVFSGMPIQFFGPESLNIASPMGFAFGDAVFGNFASTSITQIESDAISRAFRVVGEWTPGTFEGGSGGPFGAQLTIALTETAPGNGGIASAFSFDTPIDAPTPEPATLVLFGSALALGARRLRKRRSN